jgi:hypothetical protein
MFIDWVIHICDRIMRQTAQQNATNSDPKNFSVAHQEIINKSQNETNRPNDCH